MSLFYHFGIGHPRKIECTHSKNVALVPQMKQEHCLVILQTGQQCVMIVLTTSVIQTTVLVPSDAFVHMKYMQQIIQDGREEKKSVKLCPYQSMTVHLTIHLLKQTTVFATLWKASMLETNHVIVICLSAPQILHDYNSTIRYVGIPSEIL